MKLDNIHFYYFYLLLLLKVFSGSTFHQDYSSKGIVCLVPDGFLLAPAIWRKSRERALADKGGKMPCAWVEKTVWYKCAYRDCRNSSKPSTFLRIAIFTRRFCRRGYESWKYKNQMWIFELQVQFKMAMKKCLLRKEMEFMEIIYEIIILSKLL